MKFIGICDRLSDRVRACSGALLLLSLATTGCESQGEVGFEVNSISTRRSAIVSDLVREGVRLREEELMAGSGAEGDVPVAVALEAAAQEREAARAEAALLDADGGVDPFAEEGSLGDDSVRCGDGEVAEDELCDIAITAGEEGACPTRCDAPAECPALRLIVRGCWSRCASEVEPAPEGC